MYDGDKSRDASDKIRGFLFQDYIAIMCLLDDQVEFICSECLEDVDVFYKNGEFVIIQAKYYPHKSPNKKEIFTDLYYQFLRLQLLNSKLKAIPSLYIHRKPAVVKPTLEDMKEYVGNGCDIPEKETDYNEEDVRLFLKNTVYKKTKKEEQKKTLFSKMASEESLQNFIDMCSIVNLSDITNYRTKVMEKLVERYPNMDASINQENRKLILLGLAISYIQRRYTLKKPNFEQLKVEKKAFDQYMQNAIQMRKEESIVYYLIAIISEKYNMIIQHNELTELQIRMLHLIYNNTVEWIKEIASNEDGQCRLLYTISDYEKDDIVKYRDMSLDSKILKIAECRQGILSFLGYLWKIMLDICQDKMDDEEIIFDHLDLFKPSHYIVDSVGDYICFCFPEDKAIKYAIILPSVGNELNSRKRKIIERMIGMNPKPEKWFMQNNKLIWGKNFYNYSTANVCNNPSVVDLGEDSFYIECMGCIGIDEGEWSIRENCSACIFTEQCIKEVKTI